MKKVKVSILVPTYNAEKFLRQSLDSLVNQTLKEIEIICINDGSTDDSLNIIKKYSEKDDRFVILDKKNSGYGDSLNHGMKKANGEYIAILEPDDFIDSDAYELMYKNGYDNDADIVRANYYHYLKGKDSLHKTIPDNMENKLSDPSKDQFIFMEPPAVWSSIYNNNFIKNNCIEFLPTPGASYQDAGFNFKVLSCAHKVYYLNKAFLHYRRDNEASSVHSKDKVMCVHDEYDSIEKFLCKNKTIDTFCDVLERIKFRAYSWNLSQLSNKLSNEFLDVIRKEFKEAEQKYPSFISTFNTEERVAYKIIMRFPKSLVIAIFKIYRRIVYGKY